MKIRVTAVWFLVGLLCACFAVSPSPTRAQSLGQAQRLLTEAEKLMDKPKSNDDLKIAFEKLRQALPIYERAGKSKEASDVYWRLGKICQGWGEYHKALEYYEKSLAICRKVGNLQGEGGALHNIGIVYFYWGQYDKALEHYEKKLTISKKLGNAQGEGDAQNDIGIVYQSRGQYNKALEYYEKALAISWKLGDVKGEGKTLHAIGSVYSSRGQYGKALEHYEKSLAIRKKLGDVSGEGKTLHNIGNVYRSWGQHDKALECYEKSLAIFRKLDHVAGEGYTLINIGEVYRSRGQYDKALEYYEKSRAIRKKIGVPTDWAEDRIGNLHLDMGRPDKAEEFIRKGGYHTSIGRLALVKSDFRTAGDCYEKALKQAGENRYANGLFLAYTGLGTVYEALEDYKKAEEYYEKGMKFTEEMRSRINPSERKNFFEVKEGGFYRSDPAKGLTRVRMKLNQAASGIDSSEMTRARAFSDGMTRRVEDGVSGVPLEVLEKEDQLAIRVAALKKDRDKVEKDKNPQRYETVTKEVEKAEAELAAFVDMLWERHRPYAAVKHPRPVALKDAAIRPDEHVVIFDVVGEGVGIWLVRGKEILETYYKKWKSDDLEKTVHTFRNSFEAMDLKGFDVERAKELYKNLLSRILTDVPQGTPLTIIPDGVLAVLPFEALVASGDVNWKESQGRPLPSGLTFVGDLYPIGYYQSITALTLARTLKKGEKVGKKTLVIADPIFAPNDDRLKASVRDRLTDLPDRLMGIQKEVGLTFPRLPLTRDLGESLKKLAPDRTDLLMGQQAQKSALFKNLTEYRSIVFATHGYFGNDIPAIQEPVLAMTLVDQPEKKDGFLRMSEVMGMTLNADIVALTACQTGLGERLSGEGVMSMGRAFQYAGARSILMSLWSVAETSSVDLVSKFFKYTNEGKSKLEAMKLAREEIRKEGFDHPFFWAPFILVGEVN